jgi:alanyl-tRNA synthetase
VRRVEAVTGRGAQQLARQRLATVRQAAALLGAPEEDLATRAADVVQGAQSLQKEVARLRQTLARRDIEQLASQAAPVGDTRVVAAQVDAADVDTMRQMSDWLRDRLGSSVVVLGAAIDGRPNLIAAVTPDLVARGVDAGQLIRAVAPVVGGGGGGRPTLAQAGGKDAARLSEALAQVVPWVAGHLRP